MRQESDDIQLINRFKNGDTAIFEELVLKYQDRIYNLCRHMLAMKAGLNKEQQKKFLDLIENAMTEGRQMGCPPTEQN
jgi:DNA-directed RNA polymerase specialized sigma24 family protein